MINLITSNNLDVLKLTKSQNTALINLAHRCNGGTLKAHILMATLGLDDTKARISDVLVELKTVSINTDLFTLKLMSYFILSLIENGKLHDYDVNDFNVIVDSIRETYSSNLLTTTMCDGVMSRIEKMEHDHLFLTMENGNMFKETATAYISILHELVIDSIS